MTTANEGDSIEALRLRCAQTPERAEPRVDLALALLSVRRAAEALIPVEQACALAPQLAAATETRAAVMAAIEAGDPALTTLELSAILQPDNAAAQLALGEAYATLDRPHDAERCLKRALSLGPTRGPHAALARLYLSVGMDDAARHHALASLSAPDCGQADDAYFVMAHQTLSSLSEAQGDLAACAAHLDRAYGRRSLFRFPAADAAFTTLVLLTREAGNIDHRSLLPPLSFDCAVWYMEHARPEQIAELPPFAVVLNAIGDPDLAAASQDKVAGFLAGCKRPVLNDPARVQATSRDRLAATLSGLADVVMPATVRLRTRDIATQGLAAAVLRAGLAPPVILRPVGAHGGEGTILAFDEVELEAIAPPEADVYVSRFHDYRSGDGFFRKYRAIFVDRRPFPYHLAIGRHWMIHHQTTDMAHDEARRAEELAFLRDPAGAVSQRVMAAVQTVGERLDLDYGGIDFSVTADGRLLVFEANATMLAHLEPEDGPFAAKNQYIRSIIDSFQARLAVLASSEDG